MPSKILDSEVNKLELDFSDNPGCKIISTARILSWQDTDCSVVVLGNIRHNAQAVSMERLAKVYLESGDLSDLYNHLSGQFYLLIFDAAKRQLHLVNDPMGIQTCYYTMQNDCLYISESLDLIKNTEEVECTLSDQAIFNYFYFHCIPAPATIYRECSKLEPGKAVTFCPDGSIDLAQLYRPEFSRICENQAQLKERCMELIDTAVEDHISDDCGAFLSGGLDSSTVAGMLARHQPNARTFSIGFDLDDYDETPYAKITAQHFGTRHDVHYLKADQAASEFVNVAQYFEEPFGNSSAMAAYSCAKFAKASGVNSLLAGDGGDELFAGNSHYAKQKQFELFFNAPSWVKSTLKALFTQRIVRKIPLLGKAASYIDQASIPLPERLGTYNFVRRIGVNQMFNADFLQRVDSDQPISQQRSRYRECTSKDPVDRMLYLDWKFTLADNDLIKVKRMCELADVAVHFPLLDREVVDFSCQVPAAIKLPGGKLRDFYKNACKGFLPDATLTKRKHGFGLPFGLWIKENEDLMKLTMECLVSFRTRNIVSDTLIDSALESHGSVHASYYGELIWIMVTLELWLQRKA